MFQHRVDMILKNLPTNNYPGVHIRIEAQQLVHDWESLVTLVVDGEDNFEVGVFLSKSRFQVCVKIRIQPFERP